MKPIAGLASWLLACVALAQQPNSATASMTIDGANGPPFPIATNLRTSLPATFSFAGLPNQPYAMYQAAALQPGNATAFGDLVDLALTPFPTLVVDGFQDPAYTTDSSGVGAFTVVVPPSIPVGSQFAFQAVMGDPSSPFGYGLTAATLVTITQGPSITVLPFSDGGPGGVVSTVQVTLPFAVPFYGQNRTQATVSLDGYVAFTPSLWPTELPPFGPSMNSGLPRCAIFWNDLVLAQGSVTSIVDATPGPGLPAYWELQYADVRSAVNGVAYDFSFRIDVTGEIKITFSSPFGVPSQAEMQVTGIAAGSGFSNAGTKDFSSFDPSSPFGFPYVGALLESIWEGFGYLSNPSWYGWSDRPFDLAGREVYFLPGGINPLPTGSNRYIAFTL